MADEGLPAASVSKWTGLFRAVDPFAIPPGAMSVADNIVIPGASLLQPRRGFDAINASVDWAAIGQFSGYLMAMSASDTPQGSTNGLFHIDPATEAYNENSRGLSDLYLTPALLSPYGSNADGTQTKTRFVNLNANLYQTTNFGLARLTSPDGTWAPAILPGPNASQLANFSLTTGTFLTGTNDVNRPLGSQVAYRWTLKYTDANGNVHVSAPSDRRLVVNSTNASKGVSVASSPMITAMVPVGAIVQTWRTLSVENSATLVDVAGDEMFLVDERPVTATAISNGYANPNGDLFTAWVDNTPDTPYLVEPLYTNPTTGLVNGYGIANANTPPPAAVDVFSFRDRVYFANTEQVQSLTVQIIGTGSGGIVNGDTVYVDGQGYYFYDTTYVGPPSTLPIARIYRTGGTYDLGSVVANIEATARWFAALVSQVGSNQTGFASGLPQPPDLSYGLRADYESPPNGVPGVITIQRFFPGAPAFSITPGTGAGEGWAGALVVDNVSSSNRQPANLMQSQPDDPESVPDAFTNTVGRLENPILRGIPLRDSCFLFKGGGDGLWKFTDDGTGTLAISPLDQTVNLVAPETAVALDNSVFCLSDKGVLRITDGGAPDNISNQQIQEDLQALMRRVGDATLARLAFGVAYESERTYVLALPETANATACTVQYVYNIQTDAWTRWTLPALSCGFVSPLADDVLTFGLRPHNQITVPGTVWIERKTLGDADYEDPGYTVIVPAGGTRTSATLVFSGDVRGYYPTYPTLEAFAVGDLAQYSPDASHSYLLRVTDVSYDSGANHTTVTFDQAVSWTGDGTSTYTFLLRKGIPAALELLPLVAGDPLYEKQWQNAYFFFRRTTAQTYYISFSTEKQAVPQVHSLAGQTQRPWLYDQTLGFGLSAWGSNAYNAILKEPLDQAAARSAELTLRLSCADALAGWQLSALRIPYDPSTMRLVR